MEPDEEIFDGVLADYKSGPPGDEESGESAPPADYDSDEPVVKKPRKFIGA